MDWGNLPDWATDETVVGPVCDNCFDGKHDKCWDLMSHPIYGLIACDCRNELCERQ